LSKNNEYELISVIIPCYNTEKYLKKCLDSIINQSYKNIEVILIDDGSTDNTGEICDEYSKVDNRIKVFHIKNCGVSHARNLGIKKARGYYVTFIDSDDYIDETMYEEMIATTSNNKPDIISSGIHYETENGIIFCSTSNNGKKIYEFNKKEAFYNIFNRYLGANVWNKLFKKSLIIDNNLFFSENIYSGEDLLFVCQTVNLSNLISHLNKDFYHYIKRDTSVTNGKFNKKLLTIIDAYKEIDKIVESSFFESKLYVEKGKIISYCGLIYKMYGNKEYTDIINDLSRYIKENSKKVLDKNIEFKSRILIWIFSKNIFWGFHCWKFYKLLVTLKRK